MDARAFEINKIVGAGLMAVLVTTVIGYVGNMLVHPKPLKQNAYQVPGVTESKAAGGAAAAAPAQIDPIGPLLAAASADTGKNVFKQCAACHTPDKGGKNGVGPNLWDIIGAAKGHATGFGYSAAIKGKDGPWDYEALNQFLANPKGYAPGTKMAFAGIRKAEDRAAVIAYLRSLADSPKPLP